ncbi:hypothetical protein [Krasilnikovia sp. MM14-A1259]|uniref:hypothetical protein n=1 Tax=Krasilnikovia sp. MM14-A1259 TaxID=3373539 RepID=UPI00382AEFC2
MPRFLRRTTMVAAGIALAAITGCSTGPDGGSPDPPCGGTPASRAELGVSNTDWAPDAATFTTSGGTLYVTVHDLARGSLISGPKGSQVNVYIGSADTPPRLDAHQNVTPLGWKVVVAEDHYQPIELPAGRYWLLVGYPAKTDLLSCTPGAVTGTPTPHRFPPAPSSRPS